VGNFVKHAANKVKEGFQHAAGKIKQGFQKVGNFVKHVANKVKDGIRHAASKVKEGFQKFGEKIKYAAGKVKEGFVKAGHWIKDNAGKVAKFGLKIWSTGVGLLGRVAGFIPGVGKVIGKAIGGISKLGNFISDKIPGQLTGALARGSDVLNKINNPFSKYIPSITQCLGFGFGTTLT
jgi:phage-related protein